MATLPIDPNDRLLWVEDLTNFDELVGRHSNETEKAILEELNKIELLQQPYVEIVRRDLGIYDVIIFKLDYMTHSYNRYYIQYNKSSGKQRIIISFLRRQAKKIEQRTIEYIKQNACIIQEVKKITPITSFDLEKDKIHT